MKIEKLGAAMTAEIDRITAAQVVVIQPGDVLALISDSDIALDAYEVARIKDSLAGVIPESVRVVVLERMRFEVLRGCEEQA